MRGHVCPIIVADMLGVSPSYASIFKASAHIAFTYASLAEANTWPGHTSLLSWEPKQSHMAKRVLNIIL